MCSYYLWEREKGEKCKQTSTDELIIWKHSLLKSQASLKNKWTVTRCICMAESHRGKRGIWIKASAMWHPFVSSLDICKRGCTAEVPRGWSFWVRHLLQREQLLHQPEQPWRLPFLCTSLSSCLKGGAIIACLAGLFRDRTCWSRHTESPRHIRPVICSCLLWPVLQSKLPLHLQCSVTWQSSVAKTARC